MGAWPQVCRQGNSLKVKIQPGALISLTPGSASLRSSSKLRVYTTPCQALIPDPREILSARMTATAPTSAKPVTGQKL